MEAALLLKEAVEVNCQIQIDLHIRTEQVYELCHQQHSSDASSFSLVFLLLSVSCLLILLVVRRRLFFFGGDGVS